MPPGRALARDPKHGGAKNNLANVRFVTGDFAGAADCLEKAEALGVSVNPALKKAVREKLAR